MIAIIFANELEGNSFSKWMYSAARQNFTCEEDLHSLAFSTNQRAKWKEKKMMQLLFTISTEKQVWQIICSTTNGPLAVLKCKIIPLFNRNKKNMIFKWLNFPFCLITVNYQKPFFFFTLPCLSWVEIVLLFYSQNATHFSPVVVCFSIQHQTNPLIRPSSKVSLFLLVWFSPYWCALVGSFKPS